MDSRSEDSDARACWFVGAMFGEEDQLPRFLKDGIWENGYSDKYLDMVKSVEAGDRIAIKASYVRKNDLPFDNHDQSVSVMSIKATGIVTENLGDGRKLKVDWIPVDPPREWYFYTYRGTIWRILPGEWITDALIDFTFSHKPQDIKRFRNAPYWQERFGDKISDKDKFKWTKFYEEMADKLLGFRNRRGELLDKINEISKKVTCLSILKDKYGKDKSEGLLKDICPFTTMGIFNRGITNDNRKIIAGELAGFLGMSEPVPDAYDGIPVLHNQKSWFFGYSYQRKSDDIDSLWEVFAQALEFADSADHDPSKFALAYDNAIGRLNVGWTLSMGLYWIRPWSFLSLDGQSRLYINKKLGIQIDLNGPDKRCNSADYLKLMDNLGARFTENDYPVHSFPGLSLAAWLYKNVDKTNPGSSDDVDTDEEDEVAESASPIEPYSIDNIISEGCFASREKITTILERFRTKKNIILQGPPGTGKTWLARRLAFALMGQRDDSKVRSVQFHPNLSYEDFIRGWRPSGDGRLSLVDGPFMEMIRAAEKDPASKYVVVIEEINRGNPAQIFGEMLTLLEADKRTPNEALELSYKRSHDERVFIPSNLYVIGTMNIADRSLALVDLALRRRFAFIGLEPTLGKTWRDWVNTQSGIAMEVLKDIESRINFLNDALASDTSLGSQFKVGHSYVTPATGIEIKDAANWFRQVVETEIGPLLDEYWFDSLSKSQDAKKNLLEGF